MIKLEHVSHAVLIAKCVFPQTLAGLAKMDGLRLEKVASKTAQLDTIWGVKDKTTTNVCLAPKTV